MKKYRVRVLITAMDGKFNWDYLDIFAKNKVLARKAVKCILAQSRAKKAWQIQQGILKPEWQVQFKIEAINLAS